MQPDRIIIVWKYVSENGQPNPDEHSDMNQLEDALERILKGSQLATLALVSTGENLREWTYYAKSESVFIERLNLALEDMPPFPIEIHNAMIHRGACIHGSEVTIRRPRLRLTASSSSKA